MDEEPTWRYLAAEFIETSDHDPSQPLNANVWVGGVCGPSLTPRERREKWWRSCWGEVKDFWWRLTHVLHFVFGLLEDY